MTRRAAPGVRVSNGRLRVDAARALAKLRDYQLADRTSWILEAVRAAVASGAQRIVLRGDANDVWLDWDGEPWPAEALPRLFDELVSPEPARDAQHLRLLGTAVNSALGLDPAHVDVTALADGTATRVRYLPEILEDAGGAEPQLRSLAVEPVDPPANAPARGMRVHLRRRTGLQTLGYFLRGGDPPELALARAACADLAVPMQVGDIVIGRDQHRRDLVRIELGHDLRGFVAVIDPGAARPTIPGAILDVAEHGVLLTTHGYAHGGGGEPAGPLPIRLFIDAARMPTNASRSDVRRDAHPIAAAEARARALYPALIAKLAASIGDDERMRAAALALIAAAVTGSDWVTRLAVLGPPLDQLAALPLVRDALGRAAPVARAWDHDVVHVGDETLEEELAPWVSRFLWAPPGDPAGWLIVGAGIDPRAAVRVVRGARDELRARARFLAHAQREPRLPDGERWVTAPVRGDGITGEIGLPGRGSSAKLTVLLDGRTLAVIELPSAIRFEAVVSSAALTPTPDYRGVVRDARLAAVTAAVDAAVVDVITALAAAVDDSRAPRERAASLLRRAFADDRHLEALTGCRIWPTVESGWVSFAELRGAAAIGTAPPDEEIAAVTGRTVVVGDVTDRDVLARRLSVHPQTAIVHYDPVRSPPCHDRAHELATALVRQGAVVALAVRAAGMRGAVGWGIEPAVLRVHHAGVDLAQRPSPGAASFAIDSDAVVPDNSWTKVASGGDLPGDLLATWEQALIRAVAQAVLGERRPELLPARRSIDQHGDPGRALCAALIAHDGPVEDLLGEPLLARLRAELRLPVLGGATTSPEELAATFPASIPFLLPGSRRAAVPGWAPIFAERELAFAIGRLVGRAAHLGDGELEERQRAAIRAVNVGVHRARVEEPLALSDAGPQIDVETRTMRGLVGVGRGRGLEIDVRIEGRRFQRVVNLDALPLVAVVEVAESLVDPAFTELHEESIANLCHAVDAQARRLLLEIAEVAPASLTGDAATVALLLAWLDRSGAKERKGRAKLREAPGFATVQGGHASIEAARKDGDVQVASWTGTWLGAGVRDPLDHPVLSLVEGADPQRTRRVVEALAGENALADVTDRVTLLQTRRRMVQGLVPSPTVAGAVTELTRRLADLGDAGDDLGPGEIALFDADQSRASLQRGDASTVVIDVIPVVRLAIEAPDLAGDLGRVSRVAQRFAAQLVREVLRDRDPATLPVWARRGLRRAVLAGRIFEDDLPVFETTTGAWVSWRALRDAEVIGTAPPDGAVAAVSGRLIVRCDRDERELLVGRLDRDATVVDYDPLRLPATADRAGALCAQLAERGAVAALAIRGDGVRGAIAWGIDPPELLVHHAGVCLARHPRKGRCTIAIDSDSAVPDSTWTKVRDLADHDLSGWEAALARAVACGLLGEVVPALAPWRGPRSLDGPAGKAFGAAIAAEPVDELLGAELAARLRRELRVPVHGAPPRSIDELAAAFAATIPYVEAVTAEAVEGWAPLIAGDEVARAVGRLAGREVHPGDDELLRRQRAAARTRNLAAHRSIAAEPLVPPAPGTQVAVQTEQVRGVVGVGTQPGVEIRVRIEGRPFQRIVERGLPLTAVIEAPEAFGDGTFTALEPSAAQALVRDVSAAAARLLAEIARAAPTAMVDDAATGALVAAWLTSRGAADRDTAAVLRAAPGLATIQGPRASIDDATHDRRVRIAAWHGEWLDATGDQPDSLDRPVLRIGDDDDAADRLLGILAGLVGDDALDNVTEAARRLQTRRQIARGLVPVPVVRGAVPELTRRLADLGETALGLGELALVDSDRSRARLHHGAGERDAIELDVVPPVRLAIEAPELADDPDRLRRITQRLAAGLVDKVLLDHDPATLPGWLRRAIARAILTKRLELTDLRRDAPLFELTDGSWVALRVLRDERVIGTAPPGAEIAVPGRIVVRAGAVEQPLLVDWFEPSTRVVHYDPARLPGSRDRAADLQSDLIARGASAALAIRSDHLRGAIAWGIEPAELAIHHAGVRLIAQARHGSCTIALDADAVVPDAEWTGLRHDDGLVGQKHVGRERELARAVARGLLGERDADLAPWSGPIALHSRAGRALCVALCAGKVDDVIGKELATRLRRELVCALGAETRTPEQLAAAFPDSIPYLSGDAGPVVVDGWAPLVVEPDLAAALGRLAGRDVHEATAELDQRRRAAIRTSNLAAHRARAAEPVPGPRPGAQVAIDTRQLRGVVGIGAGPGLAIEVRIEGRTFQRISDPGGLPLDAIVDVDEAMADATFLELEDSSLELVTAAVDQAARGLVAEIARHAPASLADDPATSALLEAWLRRPGAADKQTRKLLRNTKAFATAQGGRTAIAGARVDGRLAVTTWSGAWLDAGAGEPTPLDRLVVRITSPQVEQIVRALTGGGALDDVTLALSHLQMRRQMERGLIAPPAVKGAAAEWTRRVAELGDRGRAVGPGEIALVDSDESRALIDHAASERDAIVLDVVPPIRLAVDAPDLVADRGRLTTLAQELTTALVEAVLRDRDPTTLPSWLRRNLRRALLTGPKAIIEVAADVPVFQTTAGAWVTWRLLREIEGAVWYTNPDSEALPVDPDRIALRLTREEAGLPAGTVLRLMDATRELELDSTARANQALPAATELGLDAGERADVLALATLDGARGLRGVVAVLAPGAVARRGVRVHKAMRPLGVVDDPCAWPTLAVIDQPRLTADRTWSRPADDGAWRETRARIAKLSEEALEEVAPPTPDALARRTVGAWADREDPPIHLRGALWIAGPPGRGVIEVTDRSGPRRVRTELSLRGWLVAFTPDAGESEVDSAVTAISRSAYPGLLRKARTSTSEEIDLAAAHLAYALAIDAIKPKDAGNARFHCFLPAALDALALVALFKSDEPVPIAPRVGTGLAVIDDDSALSRLVMAQLGRRARKVAPPPEPRRHPLQSLVDAVQRRLEDIGLGVDPGIERRIGDSELTRRIEALRTAGGTAGTAALDALVAHVVCDLNHELTEVTDASEVEAVGRLLDGLGISPS